MPTENDYIIFKKITIRFLKETGLYSAFKEYLKKTKDIKEWYRKPYIDSIFGEASFTYFLEKKGILLKYKIAKIFRTYVKNKYGDEILCSNKSTIPKDDDSVYINLENDTIIINLSYEKK